MSLEKRKVNKWFEIIEVDQEIWNELYQDIIRNCVGSMKWRILKWIEVKKEKEKKDINYFNIYFIFDQLKIYQIYK